ncbi:MAG: serine hydrolase [Campylobacterales bacterium]|nr:serine hydrolase [Campylobacterales bacterium]
MVSNSKDMVRWAKALFEGKVIKQPYLDEMLKSVSKPTKGKDISGRAYGYGLGVSIVKTNYGTAFRHGGFFPGYNSMLAYFPDFKIAVVQSVVYQANIGIKPQSVRLTE